MKIKELLNKTNHRPWEFPAKKWEFYQEWNDAIFLHYKVGYTELRKFVPEGLKIDLYKDSPWVSIVIFKMEEVRPRNLPAFRPISNFHETNIRTYVSVNGKRGVYFLSIEASKKLSCEIAKGISKLPYRYSAITRKAGNFKSWNKQFSDEIDIEYKVTEDPIEKDELDVWLTERYALFQDSANYINEFEIHHIEWPIQGITISRLYIKYPRLEQLVDKPPDRTHYSAGVQVVAWKKTKILK